MYLKMYSKNVVVSHIKTLLVKKKTFTRCHSSAGYCFGFLKTLTLIFERLGCCVMGLLFYNWNSSKMSLIIYSKNVVVSYIKTLLVKKTFTRCLSSAGCCFCFFKKHLLTLYFERLVSFVFQVLLRLDFNLIL